MFLGLSITDDDFYVTSSSKPFQSCSSQFFPGQIQVSESTPSSTESQSDRDRANSIIEFANDLKKLHSELDKHHTNKNDLTTPDSGVEDVQTPQSPLGSEEEILKIEPLKSLASKSLCKKGGLRHTRDKLKLDLPPSPTSFKVFNLDQVPTREQPTFTTFGKTRFSIKHVDTPTEEVVVADLSEDSPENSEKRRIGEMVRGEASLLDSADEDSGIESSTNATLERQVENITVQME